MLKSALMCFPSWSLVCEMDNSALLAAGDNESALLLWLEVGSQVNLEVIQLEPNYMCNILFLTQACRPMRKEYSRDHGMNWK